VKITLKNKELILSTPAVMGILNITPDSFFDGGKYKDEKSILLHTGKMISEGADIIDIGACSTRPNAPDVSEEEELTRLIPAIKFVRKKFPEVIISADTFRSKVAELSVNEGADIINDISGGTMDEKMFEVIGKLKVPYVLMHIQGKPKTMQKNPQYQNVTDEVMSYFKEKIHLALKHGIKQIIIDPGFGFGKTIEHNYQLLKELSSFKEFEFPILAGVSRKAMINKVLGTKPEEALNGTTVANTIALMNGATILRVHDVKEAKEAVKIFNFVQNNK
jgi:dihydropteroate synthase